MRDATSELDDLGAACHLAGGVGEDLAVLIGDEARQGAGLAVEQFAEFEENARAGQRRRRRPGRKSGSGSLDCAVDLAGARESDAATPLAGRRVTDITPAPARSLGVLAFDIMVDVAHADAPALRYVSGRHHRPTAVSAAADSRWLTSDFPFRQGRLGGGAARQSAAALPSGRRHLLPGLARPARQDCGRPVRAGVPVARRGADRAGDAAGLGTAAAAAGGTPGTDRRHPRARGRRRAGAVALLWRDRVQWRGGPRARRDSLGPAIPRSEARADRRGRRVRPGRVGRVTGHPRLWDRARHRSRARPPGGALAQHPWKRALRQRADSAGARRDLDLNYLGVSHAPVDRLVRWGGLAGDPLSRRLQDRSADRFAREFQPARRARRHHPGRQGVGWPFRLSADGMDARAASRSGRGQSPFSALTAENTLHTTSKVTPLPYTNRYIASPPEPRDAFRLVIRVARASPPPGLHSVRLVAQD